MAPPQTIEDAEGRLVVNPTYSSFVKQNKLLASWLISTVSGELLLVFTGSTTATQIWSKASRLFTAASDAKVARLKHELHSTTKGDRLVVEYLAYIKRLCDVLSRSGPGVTEREQI